MVAGNSSCDRLERTPEVAAGLAAGPRLWLRQVLGVSYVPESQFPPL